MRTLSGLFFRRLGCTEAEFVDAVAAAPDDDAVAAWLRGRADQAAIDAWNALLLGVHMRDLDERAAAQFREYYPTAHWGDDDLIVDVIDADDRVAASQR